MGETTQGRTGKLAKRPGGETNRGERESGRNDSGANGKVGETTRILWHRGLLYKLSCIGGSNLVVKWFSSYLSGRRQRLIINGESSDWSPIRAGVPQGSSLGSLLFLIYINDIVKDIGSAVRLFADDTSLFIDFPETAAGIINTDLSKMNNWLSIGLLDSTLTKRFLCWFLENSFRLSILLFKWTVPS